MTTRQRLPRRLVERRSRSLPREGHLQQLGRIALGTEEGGLPTERLEAAAARAADLVAAGHLSRTEAATVLMVAGQTSGLGQRDTAAIVGRQLVHVGVATSPGQGGDAVT